VGAGAAGAAGAGANAAAVSLDGDRGGDGDGGSGQTRGDGPPEHLSPGYGAGYDAGFQAGLLAASQGQVPLPPPPPVAAKGGASATRPDPRARHFSRCSRTFPTSSRRRCSSAWIASIAGCSRARGAPSAPR